MDGNSITNMETTQGFMSMKDLVKANHEQAELKSCLKDRFGGTYQIYRAIHHIFKNCTNENDKFTDLNKSIDQDIINRAINSQGHTEVSPHLLISLRFPKVSIKIQKNFHFLSLFIVFLIFSIF